MIISGALKNGISVYPTYCISTYREYSRTTYQNYGKYPCLLHEIIEECYGGTAITREQVLKQIKQGTWLTQEPYDMHTFLIRYAVESAVLTASFPASYAIGNAERWDVMVGYSANKALEEYADLEATNRLRYSETVKDGRRIISVVIREPKPGLNYFLKWQPPWSRECPKSILANA